MIEIPAALIASSDDAIIALTLDGIVASWNAAAERIYGYAAEEMIGLRLTNLVPAELRSTEADRIETAARGASIGAVSAPRLRKDGTPIVLSSSFFPIRDEDRAIIAVGVIERDAAGDRGSAVGVIPTTPEETVLLVEDDSEVRYVMSRALVARGYRVLEAQNGAEALDMAAAHAAPIHLVVSDVVMPQMDGRELFEHLRGWYPGLRFLFVSGYTGGAVTAEQLRGPVTDFLPKPFSMDALADTVRSLLDRPRHAPAA